MDMEKKYGFTGEMKACGGITLRRIVALRDFGDVKAGDKGGWIEKEENLSQDVDAWVCGDARVYGNALVCGNAQVCGNARVCDNAWVFGDAWVRGDARVYDNAWVFGDALVCGDARVCGNAQVTSESDYIVFKNFWSSGRYFTYTFSNRMWKVGCFYGTGEELIKKAYADSEDSGWHYEQAVRYAEAAEQRRKKMI